MKTRTRISGGRALGLAAFLFVFTIAACDSNPSGLQEDTPDTAELSDLAARLTTNLNLSAEHALAINELLAGDNARSPGRLWTVAAELQKRLTEEQKARLFEMAAQRKARFAEQGRGRRFNQNGQNKPRRLGHRRQGKPNHAGGLSAILTTEQQEQMKALRAAHQEQMKALMQARKDGSLSPEDFREQRKALQTKMKDDVQALLTDEQRAQLEQQREKMKARAAAFKEAAAAAKAEALGLTGDQEATLEALQAEQKTQHQALIEQARAGTLDREAIKAQLQKLREAHQAAMAEILTPEQLEIIKIHNILASRVGIRNARRPGTGGPRGLKGHQGFGGSHGGGLGG
ncbi:MAG: hypothetical protein ACE5G0_06065 [Rhodothermales bacterium]